MSSSLVVRGVDSVGRARAGEISLNTSEALSREERLYQMNEQGKVAASWKPYFSRLDELYFINKTLLDLRKLGMSEREEVFLISHVDVPKQEYSTKIFTQVSDEQGEGIGVQYVTDKAELFGVDTSVSYELLKEFIQSYRTHAPKKRPN